MTLQLLTQFKNLPVNTMPIHKTTQTNAIEKINFKTHMKVVIPVYMNYTYKIKFYLYFHITHSTFKSYLIFMHWNLGVSIKIKPYVYVEYYILDYNISPSVKMI